MLVDNHKVFVTWPDCPPLCRVCLSERHYSRDCPKRVNRPTSQVPQFTFNTPTRVPAITNNKTVTLSNGAIGINRKDMTKSKEANIDRLQEEEYTDPEGFTLVKRRRSKGKKKPATQAVTQPSSNDNPPGRVTRSKAMTIVVQTSSLDDSRAPNRGSDTTSGSSTSQHNP
ncbi:uncharacterized protein VTP21DRAFT_7207 [Calcarisporiella thermophila]|uniref:uncharacterized protein n=1 Tax=Calcarisporiella thermophila TaxID=911321 RepID=UPI003742BE75